MTFASWYASCADWWWWQERGKKGERLEMCWKFYILQNIFELKLNCFSLMSGTWGSWREREGSLKKWGRGRGRGKVVRGKERVEREVEWEEGWFTDLEGSLRKESWRDGEEWGRFVGDFVKGEKWQSIKGQGECWEVWALGVIEGGGGGGGGG